MDGSAFNNLSGIFEGFRTLLILAAIGVLALVGSVAWILWILLQHVHFTVS
jgi:hypothetical protein